MPSLTTGASEEEFLLFAELGAPIETGERLNVLYGYLLGAVLMIIAALAQALWGVAAKRRSLEQVARPLSQVSEP